MGILDQLIHFWTRDNLWHSEKTLQRGTYLSMPGQIASDIYFIKKGSLKIFFEDEGEERILRLGYSGNVIAALDALTSNLPTKLYIQAIKKTELKVIKKKSFEEWLSQDSNNLNLWHKIVNQLLYDQLEREKDILTTSAQLRYQRVFSRSPQLFQEIPDKHIASYLRMTPETLSRIKSIDMDQD